jgi:hypothetical protein
VVRSGRMRWEAHLAYIGICRILVRNEEGK